MEFQSEARYYTSGQKNLGMPDNAAASRSRPSRKLGDILMLQKPSLSYADFHHQIKRNGSQQIHGIEGKTKEDELVRYMSNVPSYLERGKNFRGKPLNVGVLDWRRLEKWKYNSNSVPLKNSVYSPSTSSTAYFSKEGLSYHSSRGQSSSSSLQRMHPSSLQSHLEASPMKTNAQDKCFSGSQRTHHVVPHSHRQKVYPCDGHSQNDDLITGNADKFEEISASIPSHRIRQRNHRGTDKTCGENQSGVRLEMCEKKESNTTSEIGKQQIWGNPDVVSSWKGKLKIRKSELKGAMQTRAPDPGDYHPDCPKDHNTVVLLVPGNPPTNRGSAHLYDSAVSANHGSEDDIKRKLDVRESCSASVPVVKVSSQQCPPRSTNTEEKKSIVVRKSSSTAEEVDGLADVEHEGNLGAVRMAEAILSPGAEVENVAIDERDRRLRTHVLRKPFDPGVVQTDHGLKGGNGGAVLDKRTGSESTAKVRHPSPICRLGSAMGNIITNAGSRDNAPLRRSSSKDLVAKPGLDTDKSQANNRARSSPLKRLLDPLIKPKAANVHELAEPVMKDYSSTAGPWKSSDEQLDLLKARSMKVRSTITSAKTKGAKDFHQNVNRGSSSFQALLQVAVKNGVPLFTFAVDNESDILAATLRKSSAAEKNHSGWIYTFFTVHETKKKNALWPNQGRRANGHHVPNAVAQMVSDAKFPVGTVQTVTDIDKIKEFTLFSVNVGQVDQHATEFQPADELAAIVIKPSSQGCSIRSQIALSTTVILPGGVHTIPSKGSISTLTQRWRSGGSCDCGGWDLGCQLRVFTNHDESQKLSTSSKTTNSSNVFKLFCQVGQESQLVLSLNPFKDRIYSVKFDSSISILQAFASCVAVLDCRNPSGLFSNSNVVEERSSTASASYVTYPPHSPVGRV